MITITKLEQQFKDNKPNGFKVTLSDTTFGYLVEKDSDKGLAEGDVVTYTAEIPAGKTYKKLTIKKAGGQAGGQVGGQVSGQVGGQVAPPVGQSPRQDHKGAFIFQLKFDARMKCIQIAHDAFLAGKLDDKEAQSHCREWVVMSDALIDDLSR